MNTTDFDVEINKIKKQVTELETISIKSQMEPTTLLYLKSAVSVIINAIFATSPTQTYSVSAPSGSAPTGSLWMEDTGVLATRKIHVYSGSAWVQMK